MKRFRWQIMLGVSLILLSALFYFIHYLVFGDAHHIFIYMVGDVAFVFVEVLMVTLIIHQLLDTREKKARLKKLNMVIGVFFSEVGAPLLNIISRWDISEETIRNELAVAGKGVEKKYAAIESCLQRNKFEIDANKPEWASVKTLLIDNRDFLLRLLENPNLLEHESFTDVLWAVFHLADELKARDIVEDLPDSDHKHLVVDTNRAYGRLALQWLEHIRHLKESYPYLFSLSLRTNPFEQGASVTVHE